MLKTRSRPLRRGLLAWVLATCVLSAGPAQAAEIDLVVPTHATIRTLSVGNMIQDFWGWVVVTDGTLTHDAINAAQVQMSVSNPTFLSSSSLSASNQLGPLLAGDVAGTRHSGSITNNATAFDPLLAPSENLILPAMDWWVNIDWPGSHLSQTEIVTTTLVLDGMTATFQTTIDLVTNGPRLRIDAAQRITMIPVPEPGTAMLFGLGLAALARAGRRA